ncbi:MAG: mechanosensitive ion channel [Candidatus Nealsonbacteria bacterium]|nr:mechanosensitive ion channel [Candidatus Nealsonbacteria bacterium]
MNILERFLAAMPDLTVALVVLVVMGAVVWGANWLLLRRNRSLGEEQRFPRRIAMAVIAMVACAVVLFAMPLGDDTRSQLLGLLGLLLTVAVTLSSTTFVANAMAGLMLRAVRSYRPGDFIHVGEQFGRVTERGLFHTEIQTEDRDLCTLPNLYLVQNPVKVVRYSGTVVSATVSLGYGVSHTEIDSLLTAAARDAELQEPFVQITELGDFSVTYRVAGFLTEVKQLLTVRSRLRLMMLTTLHRAGVEIVSPRFISQRRLHGSDRVLPPDSRQPAAPHDGEVPEERIFDKADKAEEVERLRMQRDELAAEIEQLTERLNEAAEAERPGLAEELARLQQCAGEVVEALEAAEATPDG